MRERERERGGDMQQRAGFKLRQLGGALAYVMLTLGETQNY